MTIADALLDGQAIDIVINGSRIESVTPHSPCAADIDAHGLSVFPGLCNMHSHAPMTLFRGLGDDQPLDVWLNDYIWPAEQKLTDNLVYEGALQACHEMLASGTTAFNDMYFRIPAMAQAVRDSGIRAILGPTFFGDAEELVGSGQWIVGSNRGQVLHTTHYQLITFNLFAAKFGEDTQGALGVQEADVEAFGAAAALLVDEADALLLGFVEGLVGVLHGEGDVVDAALAAVFLDEGGDGAFGAGGLEEFDFGLSAHEESGLDFLVGDLFDGVAFQTHNIFPITDGFIQVGDGNADVFDVRRCHV